MADNNKEMEILKILARREEDEAGKIRNFISKLLSYWYWFVLAVVIGVVIALLYNRYAPPVYTATSAVLITENNKEGANLDEIFSYLLLKKDIKLENHIGILGSYDMSYRAISNLGWQVSWFRDMPFGDHNIDGAEPYSVEIDRTFANITDVPVYVTPLEGGKYEVRVNAETEIDGKTVKVKFEQEGEVNKPFRNDFLHFVLKQKRPLAEKGCYFVFNDPEKLAIDYQKRLEVKEADRNADIIILTLKDQDPEKGIAYLNELSSVYLKYGLDEKNRASESTVRFIERQINAVADTLRSLNRRLTVGAYSLQRQQIEDMRRAYELNSQLHAFLLQKKSEAEIARASNIPDVEVFDEARTATAEETGPKKIANILAGIFGGLMIPFLVIVGKDYFDNTVEDSDDIKKLSDIPVWGNIMRNTGGGIIPAVELPRSAVAESLRMLRTNIEYRYGEKESLVLGVHSMIPGEGKSFVALNLAAITAMNNKKVVLIEGDMHQPSIYNHLGINNSPGLSSWLAYRYPIERIVLPTKVDNMYFVPPGPAVPNTAELLATKEFAYLLDSLKKQYDIIIIDNAPASLVADSVLVRRHSDLDIFVVRQKITDKRMVEFINMVTDSNEQKKTGIVINDIRPKRYGKYSYRYGRENRLVLSV